MSNRILVVDDEESIRFTFGAFLGKEGHEVTTADSFDAAMDAIYGAEFDLLFIDIILDNQSGVNILKNIRTRGMTCPVVMITGDPNIVTAQDALRLGAFDYLIKPIKRETLIRVTTHALQHKALMDEKRLLEMEKERYRSNLEAIFRSVTDAIITVDNNMHVIEANDITEKIFGINPKGLNWSRFANDGNPCRRTCFKILDQTLKTKQAIQEYRVECRRDDNSSQVVVLNSSPLKDKDGNFAGGVLVIRDITLLSNLERELKDRHQFHNIIGKGSRMQEIFNLLEDLKDTDSTVLITGESGTGKELIAKALHYSGIRAHMPMVAVNCSSLAENLLESELFGHVKGAFTSAIKDKEGRFQLADGGTIFLDEIGDISPRIQLKLLRVLEEREFERVGESKSIKVDVRVIAATNRNLKEMVKMGEFREDLYYRLKVVEITLPPLRERREDIPLIVKHYMDTFNKRFKKQIAGISSEAEKALMNYPWRGNVRELQHAIEHAFVICHGNILTIDDLPPELRDAHQETVAKDQKPAGELEQLLDALRKSGGNKAKAARILGISRQTMYRRLLRYNLDDQPEAM